MALNDELDDLYRTAAEIRETLTATRDRIVERGAERRKLKTDARERANLAEKIEGLLRQVHAKRLPVTLSLEDAAVPMSPEELASRVADIDRQEFAAEILEEQLCRGLDLLANTIEPRRAAIREDIFLATDAELEAALAELSDAEPVRRVRGTAEAA